MATKKITVKIRYEAFKKLLDVAQSLDQAVSDEYAMPHDRFTCTCMRCKARQAFREWRQKFNSVVPD